MILQAALLVGACASSPTVGPEEPSERTRVDAISPDVRQALAASEIRDSRVIVIRQRSPDGPKLQVLRGQFAREGRSLQPSDWSWNELDWYVFPSGGQYPNYTFNTADSLYWDIEFLCQLYTGEYVHYNAHIDSIPVTPNDNTGGHLSAHSPSSRPVGEWSPDSGWTQGDGIVSTAYNIPIASGDEEHVIHGWHPGQETPACPSGC